MQAQMFSHEKLWVYGKALDFAAVADGICSKWDKRQAVGDHLSRAAESIVLNLCSAECNQLWPLSQTYS